MHRNTREVTLDQKLVKLVSTERALDEDDDLVKLEAVQEFVQLAVLLRLTELNVILLETVESEFGVVIHVDLERVPHELLANRPNLLRERSAEHHNLLVSRSRTENFLDVTAHVYSRRQWSATVHLRRKKTRTNLIQHFVTFVKNECLDVAQGELFVADQSIQTTRSTNDDVGERFLVGKNFDVLLDRSTSVEYRSLHIGKVLAEPSILVLDLVCQFTSVAHNKDGALPRNSLQLVKSRQDENRGLSETRLGLAENVDVQNSGRNADLLDCSKADGMLDLFSMHILRKRKAIRVAMSVHPPE